MQQRTALTHLILNCLFLPVTLSSRERPAWAALTSEAMVGVVRKLSVGQSHCKSEVATLFSWDGGEAISGLTGLQLLTVGCRGRSR